MSNSTTKKSSPVTLPPQTSKSSFWQPPTNDVQPQSSRFQAEEDSAGWQAPPNMGIENNLIMRSLQGSIQPKCETCAAEEKESKPEQKIQTKLTVGAPWEPYEQEADQVAAQVMSMSDHSPQVQRFGEAKTPIQMWSLAQSITPVVQRQVDEQVQMRQLVQRAFQGGGTQTSEELESRLSGSNGGGSALEPSVRGFMEPRFGADFSGVRVHTGGDAVQMNRELGAQAFTQENNIYFSAGRYDPSSQSGKQLLAHELTHVIQQTGANKPQTVQQKSKNSFPIAKTISSQNTLKVQRFEAQHHEHIERGSLTTSGADGKSGFSDAEASATYFGNWSRDMSQAFGGNPINKLLGNDLLFEILNVLAMSKFGRELNPKDFGVYSPREHIDNPAGQTNADLLTGKQREFKQFGKDQQLNSPEEDISSPEAVDKLFVVNEAGLPAYLGRSTQYIEEEFSSAADLGRNQDGLMHFGNGLHTVEDLFAHSNYIEIAVGQLFKEGVLTLSPELTKELKQRSDPKSKGGEGLDPVETFSGKTTSGRPILTTGSFVTADTLISISEAITALLNDFDPFSPSNAEKNEKTVAMILNRYETLAKSGQAGEMIKTFLHNLGDKLTAEIAKQARDAVAGEAPKADASLWDKAVSTVRGVAGAVVEKGINVVGGLLRTDWVRDLIGAGINKFGQLPLKDAYKFIMKQKNAINEFLKEIDQKLQQLPFYKDIKEIITAPIEQLREMLKVPIQAAVRLVGQMLQKAFAEATVAGTNIENQIKQQIESNVRNNEARSQLQGASPEQKISMLMNPEWCKNARISPEEAERLRQMLQSPEYVRAGPSHSQIAKDHADSPFFGTAAVLAGHIDARLRDKMIAVWDAEGKGADPALQKDYSGEIPPAIAARRATPGTPEDKMTDDQKRAEKEAMKASPHYKEIKRREEGQTLLKEGNLEEGEHDHGADAVYEGLIKGIRELAKQADELPQNMRQLANRLQTAAPDVARELQALADALPKGLENLAAEIEGTADIQALQKLAERLHKLAEEQDGLLKRVQQVLRSVATRIEGLDDRMGEVASQLKTLAAQAEKVLPAVSKTLSGLADEVQERGEQKLRSKEQLDKIHNLPPVKTGKWDPELAKSHAHAAQGQAMSPQRQALFDDVREIMNHPYDSKWWREPLLAWCRANQARLEAYIRARNADKMHHHH